MERRSFIKKGFFGSALFSLEPLISIANTKESTEANNTGEYIFLDSEDVKFFRAICPIILGRGSSLEAWPPSNIIEDVIKDVDIAISQLSLPTQDDLKTLLGLLSFRPTRYIITGVWSNWDEASYETLDGAMDGWSAAKLNIWRSAYDGIRKLVLASWYSNHLSWSMIGYPGPPFENN